jgi:ribosomal protein S18
VPVTHFFEKRKIWPFLKRKCLFLDYKMYSILDKYVRQRLLVIWKRKIGHKS